MLEAVQLSLNVDKEALRRRGIDPDTSEGKAKIVAVLLEALHIYGDSCAEELEDELEVVEALLAEG